MYLQRCERVVAGVVLTLLTLCVVDVNDAAAQKRVAGGAQERANSRRRQTPPAATDDRASTYLDAGQRHADAGDWAAALQAYKQATVINPRHAEAHIYVGDAYMNLRKYEDDFAAYKEAVRLAPSSAEAHYSLGEAYNYLDIHSAAIRPLVQATRLDPNYAEAHYGAGHAYLRQENYKEALVYLRRAVRLKNDYPEAHLSLGLTYLGLGQLKPAEEQLKVLEGMNASLARELNKELQRAAAATPQDTDLRRDAGSAAVESPAAKPQPPKPQPDGETTAASNSPRASTRKAENDAATPPLTRPAPVAPAAPPSDSAASQLAAELALWIRIKNSNDPREFDAYLNKYPAGEFAELARIRLRALESKNDATPPKPSVERKQDDAITTTTTAPTKTENTAADAAAPAVEPVTPPGAEAQREPTIEETLASLKELFSNKLTYATTAPGADANVVKVTTEVFIEYEPLQFENCRIEWRDRKDTLSVALSDLDPLAVQIEPRSRPNTTFSVPVWTLTINSVGSAPAIRELKGDGSDAVVEYNSLDLQFGNKEKAEKLAQLLQQAIKLCQSVP